MPTKKPDLPTGIARLPDGKYRAFIRIHRGAGGLHSHVFPPGTAITHMKRWREDERARHRFAALLPAAGQTLAEDVRAYLAQVRSMPSVRFRRDDLARWVSLFGPMRARKSITAGEIRAQLEHWRAEGFAANTCNHRRTALMHLWSVLDGARAPNPAADVPRYHDDSQDAPPRALSQAAADLIMACLAPSQTRARLELYRWTGWDPATLAKITPTDIRWDDAVRVPRRRKGGGVAAVWLPLLPAAWDAMREYKRLGCWGPYSTSSARATFRRGARAARRRLALAYARRTVARAAARQLRRELLDVTPKQLRHTFGTLIAGITRDDRAVQSLLQHSDIRQTHRYTAITVDPRTAAALDAVRRKVTGELHQTDDPPNTEGIPR